MSEYKLLKKLLGINGPEKNKQGLEKGKFLFINEKGRPPMDKGELRDYLTNKTNGHNIPIELLYRDEHRKELEIKITIDQEGDMILKYKKHIRRIKIGDLEEEFDDAMKVYSDLLEQKKTIKFKQIILNNNP